MLGHMQTGHACYVCGVSRGTKGENHSDSQAWRGHGQRCHEGYPAQDIYYTDIRNYVCSNVGEF